MDKQICGNSVIRDLRTKEIVYYSNDEKFISRDSN